MDEADIEKIAEAVAIKLRDKTVADGWTLQKYAEEIKNVMQNSVFPASATISAPRKMKFRVTVDGAGNFSVTEVP